MYMRKWRRCVQNKYRSKNSIGSQSCVPMLIFNLSVRILSYILDR